MIILPFTKVCTWSSKYSALLNAWNIVFVAIELVFLACCNLNVFLWLNSPKYICRHLRTTFKLVSSAKYGLPRWLSGKEFACQCRKLETQIQSLGQENPLE